MDGLPGRHLRPVRRGSATTWDSNAAAMATLGLTAIGATAPVDPTTWFQSVRGTDGGWAPSRRRRPRRRTRLDRSGDRRAGGPGHVPDDTAYATLRSFQISSPLTVADQAFVYQWPWDASPAVPSMARRSIR